MPHSHVKLSGGLAGYSATAHTQRWKGAKRSHPLCRSQHLPSLALLCWLICTAGMGHRTTLSIQYHRTKTHTPTNHALQVWGTGQHFQYNTVEQRHTPTNHALQVWGTGQHFQYNTVEQRHTPTNHALQVWGTGQHFQYNTVEQTKTHSTNHALQVWGTGQHFQDNTVEQTNTPTNHALQVWGTFSTIQCHQTNKQTNAPTN